MIQIDRLTRAIDGHIEVEIAFIDAMKDKVRRIQQSVNKSIPSHPTDLNLYKAKLGLQQLESSLESLSTVDVKPQLSSSQLSSRRGGKRTRKR